MHPRRSLFRAVVFPALMLVAFVLFQTGVRAATITIDPSKDNTLYENATGDASNGAGDSFFAGRTGSNDNLHIRRGVIAFDIAAAIPAQAIVTGVSLKLFLAQAGPSALGISVSLLTLTADWGEGTSIGISGNSATPTTGDTTWLHRFYNSTLWATPGGDFDPQVSATTVIGLANQSYLWSGAGMVEDVQAWLANPSANFGWIVRGDEVVTQSALRFNSRQATIVGNRPQLTVTYTVVPEPSSAALIVAGLLMLGTVTRSSRRAAVATFLALSAPYFASAQFDPNNPIPTPIAHGPFQIELQSVATGLIAPDLFLSAPDTTNRQFIVEQTGQVRVIENGALLPTSFMDVSNRLVTVSTGYDERGLLGLAFDPGFANPISPGYRRIFTYTSEPNASGTPDYGVPAGGASNHHSVLASWRVDPTNPNRVDPTSRTELLRFAEPQSNHNGGMITFGPDGNLYIGTGDGGNANDVGAGHNPTIGNAQDNSTVLGKMLRIDVNGTNSANGRYGIPVSNPFSVSGGAREIYATGFRNPFRFSFDGSDLLVGDVGQNRVEELDRVELGKNYGWNDKEGTFKFDPLTGNVSDDLTGLPTGLTDPILQYDHDEGISIIGGFVYRGALLPDLAGKYIFGDFARAFSTPNGRLFYADLATGEIREFRIGDDDRQLGLFVKGIGEDADGELYVLGSTVLGPNSATSTGVVLKIVPEPSTAVCILFGCLALFRRGKRSERLAPSKNAQGTKDTR